MGSGIGKIPIIKFIGYINERGFFRIFKRTIRLRSKRSNVIDKKRLIINIKYKKNYKKNYLREKGLQK